MPRDGDRAWDSDWRPLRFEESQEGAVSLGRSQPTPPSSEEPGWPLRCGKALPSLWDLVKFASL